MGEQRLLHQEPAAWRHSWHFTSDAPSGTCWKTQSLNGSSSALILLNRNNPNGLFPWRRATAGGGSPCSSPSPSLRPSTPETARTAPATPVKEANGNDNQYKRSPCLSKSVRHAKNSSSNQAEEPVTSRSDWDIHRSLPLEGEGGLVPEVTVHSLNSGIPRVVLSKCT